MVSASIQREKPLMNNAGIKQHKKTVLQHQAFIFLKIEN
jgi:hypothetical protein